MTSTGNDDQLQNDNKNRGRTNTIVNLNNKINFENKYNFIVNNYANLSHVKESLQKQKNWTMVFLEPFVLIDLGANFC